MDQNKNNDPLQTKTLGQKPLMHKFVEGQAPRVLGYCRKA
jgi:hypothetical protein